MTWREEVFNAMQSLGGKAHLSQINDYIELNTKRELSKTWQCTVRRTIEENSSDSDAFKGKYDLFYSVDGKRYGNWGIRSYL